MKLSTRTLRAIAEIITGDGPRGQTEKLSSYRTLARIIDLFHDFGERDLHPRSGAPSRSSYTMEKLEKFNDTSKMEKIIYKALDFWGEESLDPQHAGAHLNTFLKRDGYEITLEQRYLRMNGDEPEFDPYFEIRSLRSNVIEAVSLIKLTESSITEHVVKAKNKIEAGDHAGAIASCYTLVEGLLKEILRRLDVTFNENEGDIRKLYQLAADPLNLNPKGETIESFIKNILQGLRSQIAGFYELANKARDRHARRYNLARHHAKLAANSTVTFCGFLLDSLEYQQQRRDRKTGS
jgi:hypothetical protein